MRHKRSIQKMKCNKQIKKYILILLALSIPVWIIFLSQYPSRQNINDYCAKILNPIPEEIDKITIELIPSMTIDSSELDFKGKLEFKSKLLINEFCNAVKNAKKDAPSHPSSEWQCLVTYLKKDTSEKPIKFVIEKTANKQGTLILIYSDITSGWFLGYYRNDELEKFIMRESQFRGKK